MFPRRRQTIKEENEGGTKSTLKQGNLFLCKTCHPMEGKKNSVAQTLGMRVSSSSRMYARPPVIPAATFLPTLSKRNTKVA